MRRQAISLQGFEQTFAQDADPWKTWTSRYEAVKRDALAKAVGAGRHGRVLEVAAGNGSNTRMLASRALRLTATEGTASGTKLLREATEGLPNVEVVQCNLKNSLPGDRYDLIVISEVLYYLPDRAFESFAREVARTLRPGGRLVLAHHRDEFADRARPAHNVHPCFIRTTQVSMKCCFRQRARRWLTERWLRSR